MDDFTNFNDLQLSNSVIKAVEELGFTELTPIQAKILPHTLAGQDAIGKPRRVQERQLPFLLPL